MSRIPELQHDVKMLKDKYDSLDGIQQSYIELFDRVMSYNKEVMARVDSLVERVESLESRVMTLEIRVDQLETLEPGEVEEAQDLQLL